MRKSTPVVSSGEVASYDSVSRQTIVSPVRHLARGEIFTVRYEAVNAMLLNEFLKERRQLRNNKRPSRDCESKVAKQALTALQQQQQIEGLAATVQKVSNQLEVNKGAQQVVASSQ